MAEDPPSCISKPNVISIIYLTGLLLSFLIGIQLKSPGNIKKVCDTSHFSIFTAYLMLSLNEKNQFIHMQENRYCKSLLI